MKENNITNVALDKLINRHLSFWKMEKTELPILGIFPDTMKLDKSAIPTEKDIIEPQDIDIEAAIKKLEGLIAIKGGLDALCTVIPPWEIDWTEIISGCPVKSSDSHLWISRLKYLDSFLSGEKLTIDKKWIEKLGTTIQILNKYSTNNYVVAPSIIRGPADLLGAFCGHEEYIYLLLDNPYIIKRLNTESVRIALEVTNYEFERVPRYKNGMFNRFGIWAPGKNIVFQEDAAVLLSPDLYKEHVFPSDVNMSSKIEYVTMHLHSPCLKFVIPLILQAPEINAIQVRVDPSGPVLDDLVPVFQKIQEKKPLIIGGDFNIAQIKMLCKNLKPGWLSIITKENAIEQFLKEM